MRENRHSLFEQLDFVYMPSADVAADVDYFTRALGAELVFAIERFGTRVAMVRLGSGPPALLFAEHLEGERPVLVYRVDSLDDAIEQLAARGCEPGERFGIPPGEGCEVHTDGGHRVAIYEVTRPERLAGLAGRRDFGLDAAG
jgi:hypothetical protein